MKGDVSDIRSAIKDIQGSVNERYKMRVVRSYKTRCTAL